MYKFTKNYHSQQTSSSLKMARKPLLKSKFETMTQNA